MRVLASLSLVVWLVACSQSAPPSQGRAAMDAAGAGPVVGVVAEEAPAQSAMPPPGAAPAAPTDMVDNQSAKIGGGGAAGAQPGAPVAGAMLAYTYNAGLTVPFEHVRALQAAHEKVCVDAGPAVCQVIGSRINQPREDVIEGGLELRARPDFARDFAATLEGDTAKLKGRIEQSRTSDDLTRAIIDTEAQLRAKTTLRDRLQALLRDRPGRLSDLLETEQALANVQQEIDAAQSYLAQMRQRVATSQVNIAYMTLPSAIGGGAFDPLGDAITGFFANMSESLAGIITFLSFLIPWLLVLVPLGWLVLRGAKWVLSRRARQSTSGSNTNP